MDHKIFDKTGRRILVGDTLKVFHFVGARRKHHFMYKFVEGIKELGKDKMPLLVLSHLSVKPEHCYLQMDSRVHDDFEIVQGYGEDGLPFSQREIEKVSNE